MAIRRVGEPLVVEPESGRVIEGNGVRGVELQGALKEQVRHAIGAFATPDVIHIAPGLPKTRSGKIMRRILRNTSRRRIAPSCQPEVDTRFRAGAWR